MKTQATKPTNGRGRVVQCPGGVECTVAQSAADTLGVIDSRFARVEDSITRLHDEALNFRRVMIESHEELLSEVRALRREEVDGA